MRQTASVEPLVGLAVLASWLGIWVFAARQVAKGRRRFAWVFFAPPLVGFGLGLWLAIRGVADRPLMAIILGLILVPSMVLFIRAARDRVSAVPPSDPTWKLSSAQFDYIIWAFIGLPFVGVLGLIVLLIASALGAVR